MIKIRGIGAQVAVALSAAAHVVDEVSALNVSVAQHNHVTLTLAWALRQPKRENSKLCLHPGVLSEEWALASWGGRPTRSGCTTGSSDDDGA